MTTLSPTAEMNSGENIKVVCRVRPLNAREEKDAIIVRCLREQTIQLLDKNGGTTIAAAAGGGLNDDRVFNFDRVFDWNCSQRQVYDFAARPIIESVLRGFNGTVLAYGQTASGKTHTMQGVIDDGEQAGIIPRMVNTIFEGVDSADQHIEWTVKVTILEIYMEKIRDLMDASKENLKIHEDKNHGIYVGEASEEYVTCEEEVFECLRLGQDNRSVAATNMNAHSSRSHLVFILTIAQKSLHDGSVKTGKLYLVDLAGSEKVSKTGAAGSTLDEAKMINKSLSALGNVINSLTESRTGHVPYRDSKLTRVLQQSLGGNSKTCLIITASPATYNAAETLSTLRFGYRAKQIKNVAKINQERSIEELKLLLEKAERRIEEQRLRIRCLEEFMTAKNLPLPTPSGSVGGAGGGGGLYSTTIAELSPEGSTTKVGRLLLSSCASPSDELSRAKSGESEIIDDTRSESETLQLMEELYAKNTELKEQAEQISELSRRCTSVVEQQAAVERENKTLVNQITDLQTNQDSLQYERQELQDNVQQLTAQFKAVQQEMQLLQHAEQKLREKEELRAKEVKEIAEEKNGKLLSELSELRQFKLSAQPQLESLKRQVDNLETSSANNETADALLMREKASLKSDLDAAVIEVSNLKVRLLEEVEQSTSLKKELSEKEDATLKRKVAQLDQHLDQLTNMYHKLVSQNSGLKVENQVFEKKIQRKDARVMALEKSLKEAKGKYEKLLEQCANLTSTVEHMYRSGTFGAATSTSTARRNIARPLKGGSATKRNHSNALAPNSSSNNNKDSNSKSLTPTGGAEDDGNFRRGN